MKVGKVSKSITVKLCNEPLLIGSKLLLKTDTPLFFVEKKRHLVDKCKKALSALKEDPFKSINLLYFESFC